MTARGPSTFDSEFPRSLRSEVTTHMRFLESITDAILGRSPEELIGATAWPHRPMTEP